MTRDQAMQECAATWKAFNTWNLSFDDFVRATYRNGPDGKGRINGNDNSPGDTVYTTPEGSELTRAMAESWCQHWRTYSTGFMHAWERYSQSDAAAEPPA